ncbi:unnamed protein product [Ilex paraguariensis]|uniref:Cytochrome P450 n=1 Tax=Ilex paraguariensis TaxID=185542 RepID=A0ABC8SHK1_9AQUA
MEQHLLPYSYACASIVLLICIRLCYDLLLKPQRLRLKLRRQGIDGPKPSFMMGNIPEIKHMKSMVKLSEFSSDKWEQPPPLDTSSILFPHFNQWTKQYDPYLVKEINQCKSLDLGKPAYLQKDRGPLLGKGLITTNRGVWSHQRKTIAPQLYMDKVKDMLNIVVESASTLVKSWESVVESEGGTADIKVDDYVREFTSHVFSRITFGSNYSIGAELLPKCRALIKASESPTILNGLPFYRYLPTKKNRDLWRLEKEVHSMIIDTTKKLNGAVADDMIQVLMDGAKRGELGPSTPEKFIVDNCKDLYLAAFEVTAIATIWGLMLLASHPEWQARVRAEILEVCGGNMPDGQASYARSLPKHPMLGLGYQETIPHALTIIGSHVSAPSWMATNVLSYIVKYDDQNLNFVGLMQLKMVIQEVLRLHPPVAFVSREALQDVKLGKLRIPKGVNIWIWLLALHQDPKLWGPEADKFNPARFANGISGACTYPHAYAPFGIGARICPGQSLAMLEMKVILALILPNFSFSLSPNYCHAPHFGLLLEPKHGVNLLMRKI